MTASAIELPRAGAELGSSPFVGYAYAYPHKTAYRRLEPPVPLAEAWSAEPRRAALFLYVHVPFCEMRCGFCNLFTAARPRPAVVSEYLSALARQAARVRSALDAAGGAGFARMAVGGGTPTYLAADQLDQLFAIAASVRRARAQPLPQPISEPIPISVEVSPDTCTAERLAVLRRHAVGRVSIGVQSFIAAETAAVGRPQEPAAVRAALGRLREVGFPVLNVDLMYGLPGQDSASWERSLTAALEYRPEELYLYPTYVRPLTGLGNSRRRWDDQRVALYRQGRERLLTEGYRQVSMRMFRSASAPAEGSSIGFSPTEPGPAYCCQTDGMVGLGCGARSYTTGLHWSGEYAVGVRGVSEILADWIRRSDADFDAVEHGFRLSPDEQRRRFVIQSLLTVEGLSRSAYRERFGSGWEGDFPQLAELPDRGWAEGTADRLTLTPTGLEWSDAIGPWLYSPAVRASSEGCAWR